MVTRRCAVLCRCRARSGTPSWRRCSRAPCTSCSWRRAATASTARTTRCTSRSVSTEPSRAEPARGALRPLRCGVLDRALCVVRSAAGGVAVGVAHHVQQRARRVGGAGAGRGRAGLLHAAVPHRARRALDHAAADRAHRHARRGNYNRLYRWTFYATPSSPRLSVACPAET